MIGIFSIFAYAQDSLSYTMCKGHAFGRIPRRKPLIWFS